MFCLKCGKQIDDSSMNCPHCGCPTENAGSEIDAGVVDPSIKSAEGLGIGAIVLGAIGAFFAWLLALLGYVFGGAGLALALVGRAKDKYSKKCFIGLIVSIVALVFSVTSSVIGVILVMM